MFVLRGGGGGGFNLNAIFPPLDMALMEYLVHVSSNQKTLRLSREPMLWGVL